MPRGRPRGDRTERLYIRCTERQRAAWQTAADLDEHPLSDWARRALDRIAREILARAAAAGLNVGHDDEPDD